MKFQITLLVILALPLFGAAQIDKKLKKLLGYEFVQLEAPAEVGDNTNWEKYIAPVYPWAPKGATFYPSETFIGDTTGASNEGEFLMFQDNIAAKKGESFKLFRLDWVTNWEYDAFIKWVRDSTIMELVYTNQDPTGNNSIPDEDLAAMLNHPDVYYNENLEENEEFDPSQPSINRQLFNFSWSMNGISDYQIIPLIRSLYLPPNERFNRSKDWDEKKLWYAVDGNRTNKVMISPDRDVWAEQSKSPFDFYYNLANYYSREEPSQNYPAIGLLGTQIKAFLDFKERMLQKELDDNGYAYTVHISLPTEEEIKLADTSDCDCKMSYLMKEKDMTEHWKITNESYWEFMMWVQDSILRETIYYNDNPTKKHIIQDQTIGDMLNYEEYYYDGPNEAWTEFDPSQPFINRGLFNLNFSFNWKKELKPMQYIPVIKAFFQNPSESINEKGHVDPKDFKLERYVYRYYWIDIGRRAQKGDLSWNRENQEYRLAEKWLGRGLDMDKKMLPGYRTGVRRHQDLGQFINLEAVSLYPGVNCRSCNQICQHEHGKDQTCDKCTDGWEENIQPYDFWSEPDALIQGLTHSQAMAYYNWKFHRHTWAANSDSRFYDDLVPTEEQFTKVQKGESVSVEKQKLQYPDPWFRYVIHVYPKK